MNPHDSARRTVDSILTGLTLRPGPISLNADVIYFEPNETAQSWVSGFLAKFVWNRSYHTINFKIRLYESNLIISEDLVMAEQKVPESFTLFSFEREKYDKEIWCNFEIHLDASPKEYLDHIFSCQKILKEAVFENCKKLVVQLIQNTSHDLSNLLASNHANLSLSSSFMNRLTALTNECLKTQRISCDNHFIPEVQFPECEFVEAYMSILDVDPLGRKKILDCISSQTSY